MRLRISRPIRASTRAANQKPRQNAWTLDSVIFSQFSLPYFLNDCICQYD
jgi:hypothetical protein